MVEITIIIPVYNGTNYLERTIKSLLNQTFKDFEILCIDDGSTDNSYELLKELSNQDNRVRVFRKENEGTAARAVSYGLQFASGNFFMYASQDDLFSIDLLENNIRRAHESNLDAVIPNMEFYYDDVTASHFSYKNEEDKSLIISGVEAFYLSLNWRIHGFVLWRMSIIKKVGFFTFNYNSDEYSTRIFYFNCESVGFSDGIFYYRKDNPNAITMKWRPYLLDVFHTYDELLKFIANKTLPSNTTKIINGLIQMDLIRIYLIYIRSKANIGKFESLTIENRFKTLYREKQYLFKEVDFRSNLKLKVINRICRVHYSIFKIFCYSYLKIKNG